MKSNKSYFLKCLLTIVSIFLLVGMAEIKSERESSETLFNIEEPLQCFQYRNAEICEGEQKIPEDKLEVFLTTIDALHDSVDEKYSMKNNPIRHCTIIEEPLQCFQYRNAEICEGEQKIPEDKLEVFLTTIDALHDSVDEKYSMKNNPVRILYLNALEFNQMTANSPHLVYSFVGTVRDYEDLSIVFSTRSLDEDKTRDYWFFLCDDYKMKNPNRFFDKNRLSARLVYLNELEFNQRVYFKKNAYAFAGTVRDYEDFSTMLSTRSLKEVQDGFFDKNFLSSAIIHEYIHVLQVKYPDFLDTYALAVGWEYENGNYKPPENPEKIGFLKVNRDYALTSPMEDQAESYSYPFTCSSNPEILSKARQAFFMKFWKGTRSEFCKEFNNK